MYFIYRNNRKFRKSGFKTYEKARQEIRKYIRSRIGVEEYDKTSFSVGTGQGVWDHVSRSPSAIGTVGFSIRKA